MKSRRKEDIRKKGSETIIPVTFHAGLVTLNLFLRHLFMEDEMG